MARLTRNRENLDFATLAGAVARGWCHEKNEKKVMDTDLALAIIEEVQTVIDLHFGPQYWAPVDEEDESLPDTVSM